MFGMGTGVASRLLLQSGGVQGMVTGVPGVPWYHFSLPVLAISCLGLCALYSVGLRNTTGHLQEVVVPSKPQGNWLERQIAEGFQKEIVCYIRGKDELCWMPGLDYHSGCVVSRCRRWVPEYEPESRKFLGGKLVQGSKKPQDGPKRCKESFILRTKATASKHLKIYTSKNLAYYHSFLMNWRSRTIEGAEAKAISDALPVGEVIVTDTLVTLLAGKASRDAVRANLRELLAPENRHLLMTSALARRLGEETKWSASDENPGAWAAALLCNDPAAHPNQMLDALVPELKLRDPAFDVDRVLDALLHEMNLRAAQLREVWRIDKGYEPPPAPHTRRSLVGSLQSGGIEVERAIRELEDLGWDPTAGASPQEITEARMEDWKWLAQQMEREREVLPSDTTMVVGVAATVLLISTVLLIF